jgi:hypothetical protein
VASDAAKERQRQRDATMAAQRQHYMAALVRALAPQQQQQQPGGGRAAALLAEMRSDAASKSFTGSGLSMAKWQLPTFLKRARLLSPLSARLGVGVC